MTFSFTSLYLSVIFSLLFFFHFFFQANLETIGCVKRSVCKRETRDGSDTSINFERSFEKGIDFLTIRQNSTVLLTYIFIERNQTLRIDSIHMMRHVYARGRTCI